MALNFVTPFPDFSKILVRKEFTQNEKRGHGEYIEGIVASIKSIKGQAFRFETYFYQYGALYDKLPLAALCWKELDKNDDILPLDFLQIWDCLSYWHTTVEKPLLKGLRCEFLAKNGKRYQGEYLFTIDTCNPDPRIPDFTFSETPDEHKSYNFIKMDNGQFAAQPNNRMRFFDPSLNPRELKTPDFEVALTNYSCEEHAKWRLGDTTSHTYDDRTEETADDSR